MKKLENTTYEVLILSLLFGMTHVKEKEEQKLFFDPDFDATFEEAVEFMKEKLSLTKEEFYSLDAKARFRAFTVARLTGLDAIERVKEKLTKALEEGKTIKEWVEELGEDGILKMVGFHQSNPWYLETVFRTNISTAYNAGRLMQIQRSKDKIKYLEYVAIEDSRTTPICRRLDGTRLPPDDPFWATYTPPNHFNCRSTVRAIFKGSEEAKRIRKRKPKDIPPVPEGFAASPLDSWWKLTDSMAKRIVNYGLKDEVLEKAKRMCGNNFADECPEWEEIKKLLDSNSQRREVIKKLVGKGRISKVRLVDGRVVEVEKGQVIELFVHDATQKWIRSKIAEIFEDELGNRYYLTEFHLKKHLLKDNFEKLKKVGFIRERQIVSFIRKAIKRPQIIIHDTNKNAILFGRKIESKGVLLLPTAGIDSGNVETILIRRNKFQNTMRYKVLYSEVKGW
ncbi:phage head morphogenesis protein [Desulfurobacterium sp.]